MSYYLFVYLFILDKERKEQTATTTTTATTIPDEEGKSTGNIFPKCSIQKKWNFHKDKRRRRRIALCLDSRRRDK